MRRLAAAVLLLAPLAASAQTSAVERSSAEKRPAIERMDPPFWWVGMEQPDLQVMVYGPDVGRTRVTMDVRTMDVRTGVRLERVAQVENPNYAFLYLQIADEAEPGTLTFRFEHADSTFTRAFELRARDTTRTYARGFSSEDVIYLMMPDRFASGTAQNDSLPGLLEGTDRADPNARHGGDILGVMEHLDYIESLSMDVHLVYACFREQHDRRVRGLPRLRGDGHVRRRSAPGHGQGVLGAGAPVPRARPKGDHGHDPQPHRRPALVDGGSAHR